MASASGSHDIGSFSRPMRVAAAALSSNNNTLISDFRRTMVMMREIAIEFEKQNDTQKVEELEDAVIELLGGLEDSTHLSNAVQALGNNYRPGSEGQFTDFKKLLDDEFITLKASSQSDPQKHQFLRQFKEAVWNVHHSGQPMPGEEQEEIVMTNTQSVLLNTKCPISGKPVTELAEPVRSMDCKHVYEKEVIMHHMASKRGPTCNCPVAGCRGRLRADRVVCDPLLLADIEEHRYFIKQSVTTEMIEDFTALDED